MGDTRCPLCKTQYHCLCVYGHKKDKKKLCVIRYEKVKKKEQVYEGEDLWMQFADACYICGIGEETEADSDKFIVCDSCDWKTCHLACLGFDKVPDGDWICEECLENPE
jgi:hypothetical protein